MWPHHSWYHLFISSSSTREKSILSYHCLLSLFLPLSLSLRQRGCDTSMQTGREVRAALCAVWMNSSNLFSFLLLPVAGPRASGKREGGNRKAQLVSGSYPPWNRSHIYSLFLLLLVLTWHSLVRQKLRWRQWQTQDLSLWQARNSERQVRGEGASPAGWGMQTGGLTCKKIAIGVRNSSAELVGSWLGWSRHILSSSNVQFGKPCSQNGVDRLCRKEILCSEDDRQGDKGWVWAFFMWSKAKVLWADSTLKYCILIHFANQFVQ